GLLSGDGAARAVDFHELAPERLLALAAIHLSEHASTAVLDIFRVEWRRRCAPRLLAERFERGLALYMEAPKQKGSRRQDASAVREHPVRHRRCEGLYPPRS